MVLSIELHRPACVGSRMPHSTVNHCTSVYLEPLLISVCHCTVYTVQYTYVPTVYNMVCCVALIRII